MADSANHRFMIAARSTGGGRRKATIWRKRTPSGTAFPYEPPGVGDGVMSDGTSATFDATLGPGRPFTRLEGLMLGAGARLDRFVLERYLRRTAFAAPDDGAALRARLFRAREFYRDPGFVTEPGRFFATPEPLRASCHRRARLKDGELLDVTYTTDFVPVFPEARGADPTAPGVLRWWRHREPGHP